MKNKGFQPFNKNEKHSVFAGMRNEKRPDLNKND